MIGVNNRLYYFHTECRVIPDHKLDFKTMKHIATPKTIFQQRYHGRFLGILRWSQLDELWEQVRASPEGWYIYLVGETLPTTPVSSIVLNQFLQEIDTLLRTEHDHDYCGIVYVDDREHPTLIKIFDPHHLGVSCGIGHAVILPRWLLSRIPPETLTDNVPIPAQRRHWWQRLFPESFR